MHGIHPEDTEDAPEFPEVWSEIMEYLDVTPVLVAHNAVFDISCIRKSLEFHELDNSSIFLKASIIEQGTMQKCVLVYSFVK